MEESKEENQIELKISVDTKKGIDYKHVLRTLLFILLWYSFSFSLSLYNKWLFGKTNYNLGFPLFVTSFHFVVQLLLCTIILALFPSLRPEKYISMEQYFKKITPCAIATSMDIGLSNLSLKTITLSFYTMCKSSSLAFVLLFAFYFKLEKPSLKLIIIIFIICFGAFLMVSSETEFNLLGFLQVMGAVVSGSLRWSLTQLLLQKEALGMTNPVISLIYLTPVTALSMLIFSFAIEGFFFTSSTASEHPFSLVFALVFAGGFLSFFMIITEFILIRETSIVTLSVAGIFKEILTIMLSGAIFGDKFSLLNIVGLVITLIGIAIYNYFKIMKVSKPTTKKFTLEEEEEEEEDNSAFMIPNATPGLSVSSYSAVKLGDKYTDVEYYQLEPMNTNNK